MRFFFGILLCFLVVNVSAGGIRGAYERMFVWFAYQAQIDYLMQTDGHLDHLEICPTEEGTGRENTLTFNEFIQYTNLAADGTKAPMPSVKEAVTLQVDKTAQSLYSHKGWLENRWQVPGNIINMKGTGGGYDRMMLEVSKVVWGIKNNGIDNTKLRNAIDAIQKVVISREIDYEKYRMPAMKADPAFTGQNKVTWVTDQLVLRSEPKAEKLDIVDTQAKNPGISGLAKKIDTWEKTTYFADKTDGPNRSRHKRAVMNSQRCVNMATTGSC
ncbi:hypothetical protein B0T10DRAFT_500489 [Thelonectria olida]|uniref:Uncharacterized protein n=1 Tax=Thelonectria olida TaxID=1576542 RepID=A0A9P8VRI9_9HYPO|nr:hypothetical protein B0T10DRAFT_500489 [Thelonectria olida]